MKRNCSEEECDFEIYEDPIDSPLNNHANHLISPNGDNSSPRSRGGLTPTGPTGLKSNSPRPSKIRRHGSKLLSALRSIRSLTNSGKNPKSLSPLTSSSVSASSTNIDYSSSPPQHPPNPHMSNADIAKELAKKVSQSFARNNIPTTVVVRTQKSRPSIVGSLDKGVMELTPEVSPSTSGEASGNSGGKTPAAAHTNSTGMTSLDSRMSMGMKMLSGHSSENKKGFAGNVNGGLGRQLVPEESVVNNSLTPISENAQEVHIVEPVPVPTVITVEKAAAAKVFFECHYNTLLASGPSPRSIRLREFEGILYENASILSPADAEARRRDWAQRESKYLREVRVMKARNISRKKGVDPMVSQYEVVKVLGKGSFGVVRLVREKEEAYSPLGRPRGHMGRSLTSATSGASTGVSTIAGFDGSREGKRKEVYAMKVIRKSDMLRNSQEGHLRAERDFLVASEGSRWVVPLIASFQDTSNLYLIMDYMPGGDFLGLLIRDNILTESVTKWYIAEMILCIEEAHRLRWIHRDIKPDNFLISASGHLKISDFGLAFDGHWSHDQSFYNNHRYSLLTKLGIAVEGDAIDKKDGRSVQAAMKLAHVIMGGKDKHEKKSGGSGEGSEEEGILNWRNRTGNRTLARSVVGTSQYMAPEVVRGEPYDARCDWWSVAVILYECLYGHTPFLAEEGGRAQTKLNILNHRTTFSFPSKPPVSSRCQDLMRRMIQEKGQRLCSRRYQTQDLAATSGRDYAGRYVYPDDAEDIKSHRWFKDILWDRMHEMTPPFVPKIRGEDDTHYFDEEEPISDFSTSVDDDGGLTPPTEEDLSNALRGFNREIQILARGYVGSAFDSTKLRRIEREIDGFTLGEEQKEYLRQFVRAHGRKEKKRPRDRLLRDQEYRAGVLECRKRAAFLGYSWRRMRREDWPDLANRLRNENEDGGKVDIKGKGPENGAKGKDNARFFENQFGGFGGNVRGKAKGWMRGRMSAA